MNEVSSTLPPATTAVPPTPQTPVKKPIDPASWPYFLTVCLISLIVVLAEVAYQYTVLVPGDILTSIIRGTALGGLTLICGALFSSAIFKWVPKYARFWRLRRYLGVSGVVSITVHIITVIFGLYGGDLFATYYTLNPVENPVIYGSFAYIILFAMLSTSTDWAMRTLGAQRWKFVHRFVYAAFASAILHFMFVNPELLMNPAGYLMLAIIGITVFGQLYCFFKTIAKKKFRSLGTIVGFTVIIAFSIFAYLSYAHLVAVKKDAITPQQMQE